ncbi:MAG: TIGR00282 family metallophosphoesterase [Verrucomicrobiota bacterium]
MPRILFLGDIVGRPGRRAVELHLRALRQELNLDLVIANGENAASGAGINAKIAHELHHAGVDGITLGDHCWDQRGFANDIEDLEFLCRPANLPAQCPGSYYLVVESGGFRLGIFTILGRVFMKVTGDDPFGAADRLLNALRKEADAWIVEMHAETTAEKIAMGWFLDGRAAAVLGTHTHAPTADARVLPRGTAYITDVGMSGPYESVLGRAVGPVVARFVDGMPRKFDVATGDVRLCGAIVEIEPRRGLATSIERFERSYAV